MSELSAIKYVIAALLPNLAAEVLDFQKSHKRGRYSGERRNPGGSSDGFQGSRLYELDSGVRRNDGFSVTGISSHPLSSEHTD